MADRKLNLHGIEIEVDISDAQLAGGKNADSWHVVFTSSEDEYLIEMCGSYEALTSKLREALQMLEQVAAVAG